MAGANRLNWPRRGSLQIWPRVRAKRIYPRIKNWPYIDAVKLLGFLGYKVAMAHTILRDNRSTSLTKGQQISIPVTIIECPSLKVASIRFYKNTNYGKKTISQISSSQQSLPQDFDDIKLLVHSQPKLTGIGKKKFECFEVAIGGSKDQKLEYAKKMLGKEIKVSDVFKEGQFLDVHSVSKGKGFQGTVKRFGVKIRQDKSEKVKRGVGTLGPWIPAHVSWRVAQPGKMGYHTRTEYNKWLIKISNNPNEINKNSGFVNYGNIKNEFLLLKGSIPGHNKRPIIITESIKSNRKQEIPEIVQIIR